MRSAREAEEAESPHPKSFSLFSFFGFSVHWDTRQKRRRTFRAASRLRVNFSETSLAGQSARRHLGTSFLHSKDAPCPPKRLGEGGSHQRNLRTLHFALRTSLTSSASPDTLYTVLCLLQRPAFVRGYTWHNNGIFLMGINLVSKMHVSTLFQRDAPNGVTQFRPEWSKRR